MVFVSVAFFNSFVLFLCSVDGGTIVAWWDAFLTFPLFSSFLIFLWANLSYGVCDVRVCFLIDDDDDGDGDDARDGWIVDIYIGRYNR